MQASWPEIRTKIRSLRRRRRWLAFSNLFSPFYLRNALYGKYSERTLLESFRLRLKRFLPDLPSRWNPALNFAAQEGRALVLAHEGEDSELCRQAAAIIGEAIQGQAFSPILITSMPDFSHYIRQGWLVEYLPSSPDLLPYARRKFRYLCIRYRKGLWLPLEAAFAPPEILRELLEPRRPIYSKH